MASDAADTTVNILATIATACIFLSMIPGMYAVHKKRNTLGVNFYPLAAMFGQSMGWVVYSWADGSFFPVGAVNCLGAVLGAIFSGVYILHEKELRARYMAIFAAVVVVIIALILYRFLSNQDDDDIAKLLGIFADIMAVIMFGSPLMLMGDVIKMKNSEIIAAPMAVSGLVNGALWTAYGIMQSDYYVLVPNAIGGILCFVQVMLVIIFPRKASDKKVELMENFAASSPA
jgi:solute carrier family 50 protein (sugar transporter)